jgi:ABC-2 type transport system permease protein
VADLGLWASYRVLISSRIRSQLAYRTSFVINALSSAGLGIIEFIEIYVILTRVPVFGGLDLAQAALVFALANLGFAFADMVFGQLDTIPTMLRMGRIEALLVRPMPLLAQLITTDLTLRRAARVVVNLGVLAVVLVVLHPGVSPAVVYLLVSTPVFGTLIYGGLFAIAGGVQFFLIDGAEFTSSFVYGGAYAGELPGSALIAPVRIAFTFVIPATLTGYLPALLILGLPGPEFLPAWLGWLTPVFAAWTWLLAWLAWRAGLAKFTGAGG